MKNESRAMEVKPSKAECVFFGGNPRASTRRERFDLRGAGEKKDVMVHEAGYSELKGKMPSSMVNDYPSSQTRILLSVVRLQNSNECGRNEESGFPPPSVT